MPATHCRTAGSRCLLHTVVLWARGPCYPLSYGGLAISATHCRMADSQSQLVVIRCRTVGLAVPAIGPSCPSTALNVGRASRTAASCMVTQHDLDATRPAPVEFQRGECTGTAQTRGGKQPCNYKRVPSVAGVRVDCDMTCRFRAGYCLVHFIYLLSFVSINH